MYLPHLTPLPFHLFTKYHADHCALSSRFDSSKGRGAFKTEIGVGKVIKGTLHLQKRQGKTRWLTNAKGWDEGVTEMSLGERSILTISGYEHAPKPQRLIPRC